MSFIEFVAWIVVAVSAIAVVHGVFFPSPLSINERRAVRIAKRIAAQREADAIADSEARDSAIASELSHLQTKWGK